MVITLENVKFSALRRVLDYNMLELSIAFLVHLIESDGSFRGWALCRLLVCDVLVRRLNLCNRALV